MSHRSKHRRTNWTAERLEAAQERVAEEAKRPAPKVKERRRRALPVSVFLRSRVYR